MMRVLLWHFEDRHLREETVIKYTEYKAMEWVQGYGMGTRLST